MKLLIGLLLMLCLSSCVMHVEHYDVKSCPVHEKKLHRVLVRSSFGLQAYDPDTKVSPYAKQNFGMGCLVPVWPIRRLALIRHCKQCTHNYKNARKAAK